MINIILLQLNARRCLECGQVLPETYQPPADEDWTTGICGCFSDVDSCKIFPFFPSPNYECLES